MVTLSSDITQEELQVFLQDTDEQLQLLDKDIIKLERGDNNEKLLQEIFRAAHTIKGSSAMLGYHKMADLTHAMENILDRLRKGTLSVNTRIVDALLSSLDALRVLRENLTSPDELDIDVALIIATLGELANRQEEPPETEDSEIVPETDIYLDKGEKKRIEESLALGHKICQINMEISKESQWAAVRCLQALNELALKGTVIASDPSREEVESQKVNSRLEVIFAGLLEKDAIKKILDSVSEIENVAISAYDPSEALDTPKQIDEEVPTAGVEEKTAKPQPQAKTTKTTGVSAKQEQGEAVKVAETVRIDVERLDSLMNMIGELVVARTRMNQIGRSLDFKYKDDGDVVALSKTFTQIGKVVDQLQLDITVARMLPVGTVFNRLPRLVRDLANKMGKKIDFIVMGQETGIDRSVIEHIRDPLVHLLRNAVDHGVESPQERKAAGKPEKATVRLSAAHEQNFIVITVEDDGRGIDGSAIKETAARKGIITAEAAARMSDSEAIELIFEAGVTTAKATTDVSGRGVGMDIVRKNVEAFNGVINVDTKVGRGTKFILRLPLTLATIQGLLVSSGGTTYAIPLVAISETLRLKTEAIQTITQKEVIRLRDRIVPLLRLNQIFGADKNERNSDEMIHVVVAKIGERMVGLVVDSLIEPQEVIVKSMSNLVGNIHGIAGASILGSGDVALILDVPSLIKSCSDARTTVW